MPRHTNQRRHRRPRPGGRVGAPVLVGTLSLLAVVAAGAWWSNPPGVQSPVPTPLAAPRAMPTSASPAGEQGESGPPSPSRPPSGNRPDPKPRPGVGASARWRHLLERLDHRRAVAFATDDPRLLSRVYPRRSPVWQEERAKLLGYRRAGLRVVRIDTDLNQVAVVQRRPGRVTLHVTDRLVRVVARNDAGTRVVQRPADKVTAWLLTLRRAPTGTWRMVRGTALGHDHISG